MPGADIRTSASNRYLVSNGRIAQIEGALSAFGIGFALPLILISFYLSNYVDRLAVLGLVPLIAFGIWNLGGLAGEALPPIRGAIKPWVVLAGAAQTVSMSGLAWITYQSGTSDSNRLRNFLIVYALFAFCSGLSRAAGIRLLSRSIVPSQRKVVTVRRGIIGGLLVALSGAVTYQVLASPDLTLDRAISYLLIASTSCLAAATFFALTLAESRGSVAPAGVASSGTTGRLMSGRLRRFLVFRTILGFAGIADVSGCLRDG